MYGYFISYQYIPDIFKVDFDKTKKCRELVKNNIRHRLIQPRILNIHDNKIIDDININIYEVPIFDSHIDSNHQDWIMTFHINDIIRILIANNLTFDKNGNIIKK